LSVDVKVCYEKYFPMVFRIATNVCLNRIRSKKRRREVEVEDFEALSLFLHDERYGEVEARLIMEGILKHETALTRTICFMYYGTECR
jgi:DNA-directed RNA polymerase specialized sigma24 family protein